jgi:hypothetical protein
VPPRRWLSGLVWLLAIAAAPAHAACDSTDSCLAAIEAAQKDTRTVSARFTQTKHLSLLDEPLISTGRFVFKRPDRMRLDIDSPRAATILINGRDISIPGISDSDKQQLAMTPMAAMFTELGSMFAGSPAALRQRFQIAALPADGAIEVADAHRTGLAAAVSYDPAALHRTGLVIGAMRLDDALGDHLEIVMSDVRRNQEIADSEFVAPPTPMK